MLASSAAIAVLILSSASAPAPSPVPQLDWEVVSRRPHDPGAWTQGLELDERGRLFESTGLLGRSTIREVDPWSGEVLRQRSLPDDHFGEGIAMVEDGIVQLTWQSGVAHTWDTETFEAGERFEYAGEGWGLCHDGERLVMSDGTDTLTFRDPVTFAVEGQVDITLEGGPAGRFNELECVDGLVWANAYPTDRVLRIDPELGQVTGVLDLSGILGLGSDAAETSILNGIAHDRAAGTFLVTGKLWPELIEIRVAPGGPEAEALSSG